MGMWILLVLLIATFDSVFRFLIVLKGSYVLPEIPTRVMVINIAYKESDIFLYGPKTKLK